MLNALLVLVAVSPSGHHDSFVRGIVICYRKSFHLFKLLFLLADASHSGHQDSIVRGIVMYVTQSLSGPHIGGRVVCPHVERGLARC
jgi:ribosomal protein L35AE/L33A